MMENTHCPQARFASSEKIWCLLAFLTSQLLFFPISTFAIDVLAPDTSASSQVEQLVIKGAFGPLTLTQSEAQVAFTVNSEKITSPDRIILAPPGRTIHLTASLLPTNKSLDEKQSFDDRGLFRQTNHEEIVWEAEVDDLLRSSKDNTLVWRSGSNSGRSSYVTASISQLQIHRSAQLAASPGETAPAILTNGKAGILLLPGVPFERNGDGLLQGDNIGIYPNERGKTAPAVVNTHQKSYTPPPAFYRIDERVSSSKITANLTVGDLMPPLFNSGQKEARFVAISPRLITFLIAFEEKLASKGLEPQKLLALRGFVSPTDRMRLERQGIYLSEYTRFMYGDAVALVYDPKIETTDKRRIPPIMGDVDGDGKTTLEDAQLLAQLAKETMEETGIWGGVGAVAKFEGPGASKGTPYLHLDLRGWYTPVNN